MLPYTSNSEGLCSYDKWISSLITAAQFLRWVSVLDPHGEQTEAVETRGAKSIYFRLESTENVQKSLFLYLFYSL